MRRKVTVDHNSLRFYAAHFATFCGQVEPLHGHNYALTIEVEGELQEDSWVIDFAELKRTTRRLCDELDHHFLLQTEGTMLEIEERPTEYEVRFEARRYVFPRADVYPLPLDNSTAERLAEWFVARLTDELRAAAPNVTSITVGVEEAPGQTGWCTGTIQEL